MSTVVTRMLRENVQKMNVVRLVRRGLLISALVGGALVFEAPAAFADSSSLCVNPGGTNGCYTTIQAAVNAVTAGGTVNVAAGTYAENVLIQKPLNLQGAGAATTIINASGKANGVFVKGVNAPTSISGFTVENANLEGILLENDSYITVKGNKLTGNDRNLVPSFTNPSCAGALPLDQEDCGEGLHLLGTSNSTIIRNLVEHNAGGILLTDETGPTHGNTLVGNTVQDNILDCGITLASHVFQLGSPIAPDKGGVYSNNIVGNLSQRNGGAGAGIFAAAPGAAAYNNTVAHNTLLDNGLPGVAMHSHSPFQNVNGNVAANNVISGNAADPEEGALAHPTGISVISDVTSGAAPITAVTVVANQISNEYYGLFASGVRQINGLPSDKFASTVTVPVSLH